MKIQRMIEDSELPESLKPVARATGSFAQIEEDVGQCLIDAFMIDDYIEDQQEIIREQSDSEDEDDINEVHQAERNIQSGEELKAFMTQHNIDHIHTSWGLDD